ncbi:hypothetical protein H6P81_013492 [Aristolochia fimbriata]|uniref:Wall-associated receptor kinase galacturonan-binding domain-containing protein n=1 Tax=Aristolochia fimbriata TaxID=158543 RepID=A0AAV7EF99_ARIFI|nr:hypothetical protein H6P81_013492 [Aristolochia fimbriata]
MSAGEACSSAFALFFLCFTCFIRASSSLISSCGNLHNIDEPFHLQEDGATVEEFFGLTCKHNQPILHADQKQFLVQEISYENQTVRLRDAALRSDNCSSLPPAHEEEITYHPLQDYPTGDTTTLLSDTNLVIVSCASAVDDPMYMETSPCFNSSSLSQYPYVYALVHPYVSNLRDNCSITHRYSVILPTSWAYHDPNVYELQAGNLTYLEFHRQLLKGFLVRWYLDTRYCSKFLGLPLQCFAEKALERMQVILIDILPNLSKGALVESQKPFQLCFNVLIAN